MLPRVYRAVLLVAVLVACGSEAERARMKPSPERAEPRQDAPKPSGEAATAAPGAARGPHRDAIGATADLSPELQRAFDPAGHFTPMGPPQAGDWLAAHPEAPQTFADYIDSSPNLPNGTRRVIYLLPLGEFPPTVRSYP
jgi:hypothetical protein